MTNSTELFIIIIFIIIIMKKSMRQRVTLSLSRTVLAF